MTTIRSDVNAKDLTKQEKKILRLWATMGLKLQWKCNDDACQCDKKIWEDFLLGPDELFDYPLATIRLKP
jgi:hypothetical protein